MAKKAVLHKFSLRAVRPGSRNPLAESYATADEATARRAALEDDGYSVLVTYSDTWPASREA